MSKRFSKMLCFLCCLVMLTSLMPVSFAADTDNIENAEANETPNAIFGTPELGSDDPLWALTMEHLINKSTVPDDSRPHATGTARILWDNDYLYARVVVEDSSLYQGPGGDHQYDSLEFYVGTGASGSNQWRVSATGVFSGQSDPGRAAWTEITETGYIVEMRIPKRNVTLEPGKFTFEVYINNSTENGGDRYEVVSAFGDPDTGYVGDAAFADSLELIGADEEDDRFSITTTTGSGGQITPNAPGNVLRVAKGADQEFTIIPDLAKTVDTVTVDGEPVTLSDGTYTFLNVEANHTIHATFKNDSAAELLPFIVWNDNFASGEYTTAVIIDLGEGRAAIGSELNPGLFTVSGTNTNLNGASVTFEETRKITRVYANDEPKVRGYLGPVSHSPDYQLGLESGRYIVVEFEFYSAGGGNRTLDGSSNSTKQVYSIVQNGEILLTEGNPLSYAVFEQENIVNPILDKFTTHTGDSVNRALYLHPDENGEVLQGLPLYVYTHGMSRGGTSAETDQKASMKSANGSVALMKKIEENPSKYASHILNISYNGISTPSTANVKKVIDDLVASGAVDPNRIYAAGFSWGGQYTNSLINAYPDFFAAAAPMAPVSGSPNANDNDAHNDLAYWMFLNVHNVGTYQTNINNFINTNMPKMINARASNFESNEALTWPYNQYDQPSQRPNPDNTPPLPDYIAHEVEAAVLYNQITTDNPFTEQTWSIAPIAQSPNLPAWDNDYTDVFDWMFAQRKLDVPSAPSGLKATAGDKKVTLSWTAPADDGGSAILGYKVWYGNETSVTLSTEATRYTFTGLTNGQNYTFKVVAVNAKGDSTEITATATPKKTPIVPNPSGGNTGNTDNKTDAGSSIPTYTVNTPQDKPAITDTNGNTTLPGGGLITTKGETKLEVPEGTTIDSNGKVTIPTDKSAEVTLPGDNGISLNIHEGTELVFDDDTSLGFIVISGNSFNDVNMDDWFYNYVNYAYTFGLFNGSTFSPSTSMTRAMFIQALADLENPNRSDYTSSRFSDVTDGQWYTAAVEWAAENGIVNGISADLFDPNASMTREQTLVILYNYMNYKGYEFPQSQAQSFADESEISSWALKAVKALQGIDIVAGKGNNIFDPKGIATRAEVATIFVRLIEYLAK